MNKDEKIKMLESHLEKRQETIRKLFELLRRKDAIIEDYSQMIRKNLLS